MVLQVGYHGSYRAFDKGPALGRTKQFTPRDLPEAEILVRETLRKEKPVKGALVLKNNSSQRVAAVSLANRENNVCAAWLLFPASKGGLGARPAKLLGAKTQTLMAPDGGGKTPHFGNTDSVRGPENPEGVQLLPPGSPFSEAFGLGLRAAGPPSRVGQSQVLCNSGDLDWVVLRLFFERSFHSCAGSNPSCLFKGPQALLRRGWQRVRAPPGGL